MKKLLAIIPAAALAFGAFTTMGVSASAACSGRHNSCHTSTVTNNSAWNVGRSSVSAANSQAGSLHYFIDGNNDGICDNCEDGVCLSNGLCSGYFHGHGVFIDNNNDGICDNYAAGVCSQHGAGLGHHHGNCVFIDNDNDGICDICSDGTCLSNGLCSSYFGQGNFIDNNNDGICDNCADGVCQQHGVGLGHHRGKGCHR